MKLYACIFICCIIVAGSCTEFWSFLKKKHFEGIDLTEIEIPRPRKPDRAIDMLIDVRCDPEFGKLDEFLACMDGVVKEI